MESEQLKEMSNAEINEMCAVKVMGWEVRGTSTAYFIGLNEIIRTKETTSYGDAWNPIESMNDAMILLDHFKKLNHDMTINCTISGWCCNIPFVHNGKRFYAIHHDESLPRTISICALLTVGN